MEIGREGVEPWGDERDEAVELDGVVDVKWCPSDSFVGDLVFLDESLQIAAVIREARPFLVDGETMCQSLVDVCLCPGGSNFFLRCCQTSKAVSRC